MISQQFMTTHPRAGENTNFNEKIVEEIKKHTIRAGGNWKKRVEQINAGTHYLSLRYWSGKPYCSKQVEFREYYQLGYQDLKISADRVVSIDLIEPEYQASLFQKLANNDGLKYTDFYAWFGMHKKSFKGFEGGIIFFDPHFKYNL